MSVNKVILIGNVGREPNVRYVDRDVAVASLSLATSDRAYTLPNGTQVPERTEWHSLVFWRGLAQTVEKYERIAQYMIVPYIKADYVEVDELSDTVRGEGGFGSTGTK